MATLWAITGALGVVIVVVAVLVFLSARSSQNSSTSSTQTAGKTTLMQQVSQVDASIFTIVGNAGLPNRFYALKDSQPLAGADGKPQMLYVGADYCPYCAAQRWSMVVALSRFGKFDDLGLVRSSSTDVYPDTATFSFTGTHYTSAYLDFAGIEVADRNGNPTNPLTPEQKHLLDVYDAPPYVDAKAAGGIPWIDMGGKYAMVSSGFTPQVLAGLDWNAIANRLLDPTDAVAQGIIGNANNITAAICKVTGMQPAGVCTAPPIPGLVAKLP